MTDDTVILMLDNKEIARTTIEALKEMTKPLKLKKGIFQWNAYFSVNKENQPVFELFDDTVPFENLAKAPTKSFIYRSRRSNQFKGRMKKTCY